VTKLAKMLVLIPPYFSPAITELTISLFPGFSEKPGVKGITMVRIHQMILSCLGTKFHYFDREITSVEELAFRVFSSGASSLLFFPSLEVEASRLNNFLYCFPFFFLFFSNLLDRQCLD